MRIKNVLQRVLDFILPPLCLVCDEPIASSDALCPDCWKKITFIAPPCCALCGMPFDLPVEDGTLCGACLAAPPVFDQARSAIVYDEASKGLILRFKHADRLHVVKGLALWMQRAAGPDFWDDVDLIMPIPLHRWRLLRRRYNQAALLAQVLGTALGKPVDLLGLRRVRSTPSQAQKGVKARALNVRGAFDLSQKAKQDIAGKVVALIDDVMTTGATLNEASRLLKEAGAAKVKVVTLARVKKSD